MENGVVHHTFTEEITATDIGSGEIELEGMLAGNTVKSIKTGKLLTGNKIPYGFIHLKIERPEVKIHTGKNAVNQDFELLHAASKNLLKFRIKRWALRLRHPPLLHMLFRDMRGLKKSRIPECRDLYPGIDPKRKCKR
jgi:hypothetical protein